MERALAKFAGPIVERVYNVPIPGDDYFDAIAYLFKRLQGVDKILMDPKITSVRLITNPEKIVLKETQRAFMYFCLYKMAIDGIVINRILPDSVEDKYFQDWKASQKHYMEKAREYFSPVPIFPVTLFGQEILGYDRLRSMAKQLYGGRNPLDRFYKGKPYQLKKVNGKYRLILKLPFIDKENVQLNKVSDELIIRIGSFKKHMLLPRQVAAAKSEKAELRNQRLYITFEGERHEQRKKQ
jgi:arsenite-transporting ATPase